MEKVYMQITSGRGPAECCRVVALVLEKILKQAVAKGVKTEVVERETGPLNRTLLSAVISLQGRDYHALIEDWEGTVQWIAKSPYRIYHKRKNWFVGVQTFTLSESQEATEAEIRYETLRASGPGGQHVNKTESAVRAVHIPTGMSVVASDQRSQWQNKKLATERLLLKLASWSIEQAMIQAQANWSNHNCLQRGNPVKVIQEPLI
ncbi:MULTISPECIES: peptide chain release factor H [Bacteroides]|jgi:peptide chain release factor|uniref:peptide chain release factor H n=1 Tax=Bacteroides TaxID=816 RepID=UPI000E4DC40F|nr:MULTISPECIES: peptide chain release factor H [Bacteroides]RHL11481.1 peptide chain release factor H [Bacteroides sp. AF39-11AC]